MDDILHRDDTIDDLFDYLKDLFDENRSSPQNLFIYGKPGLGKTNLTKLTVKAVEEEAEISGINLCNVYINGEKKKTEMAVLQEMIKQLSAKMGIEVPPIGNSITKQQDYLDYLINTFDGIILVVMDEFNKLANPIIINNLIRTESETTKQVPTLIAITNDITIKDRLPDDVKNVLGSNEIFITPYDAYHLGDILDARIKLAFKPDVVEEGAKLLCAAHAAAEDGDARTAIELIRISGEIAEKRGSDKVEYDDAVRAKEKLELNRIIETTRNLTPQARAIVLACILICRVKTEICPVKSTTILHQIYSIIVQEYVVMHRLSWRRMVEIMDQIEETGLIQCHMVFGGCYGRSKFIDYVIAPETTLDYILKDDRFKEITDRDLKDIVNAVFRKW